MYAGDGEAIIGDKPVNLESAALVGGPEPDGAHFFQLTFFSLVSLISPL
jgi:hypothetical protein